ncbi:hypothetical protein GCM10007858_54290 [Bradyrhizobium liaoningense]|nr:hypothetical protein GCM10007858_54290 [Bradyrhizobium liaoningense]
MAKFRETKIATFIIVVQVYRYRKAAVSDHRCCVVAVRPKVTSGRRVVAAYEVSFDARSVELKGAIDNRQKATLEEISGLLERMLIRYVVVEAFPEVRISALENLSLVFDQPNFASACRVIEIDQPMAECAIEYLGHHQHRRVLGRRRDCQEFSESRLDTLNKCGWLG